MDYQSSTIPTLTTTGVTTSTLTNFPLSTSSAIDALNRASLLTLSTLIFGFLIAVLSTLAIVICGGMIWQRFAFRRRVIETEKHRGHRVMTKPLLWDVWISPGQGSSQWEVLKPLSAQAECVNTSLPSPDGLATKLSWGRWLPTRLPHNTHLLPTPETPASDTKTEPYDLPPSTMVEVVVLIAMPRPTDPLSVSPSPSRGDQEARGGNRHEAIGELTIGISSYRND